MSHIDKALRRLEGRAGRDGERSERLPLDAYPREDPAAAEPPANGSRGIALQITRPPRTAAASPLDDQVFERVHPVPLRQYRRVADVVRHARQARGIRRLMVTSAGESDEKARAAVNLAVTIAKVHGTHGLLVDADVWRPTLHALLGASNEVGLCEWLRSLGGDVPLVQISSLIDLLPAGLPGPSALADLASGRMEAFTGWAAERYEWVLLHAPAVAGTPSATAMLRAVDGVIFVVDASAPLPGMEHAIGELGRERVLATILHGLAEPGERASSDG